MTPMSSNRSAAGVTVFEGRIHVSGGHDGLQIFNSVSVGSSWAMGTCGLLLGYGHRLLPSLRVILKGSYLEKTSLAVAG